MSHFIAAHRGKWPIPHLPVHYILTLCKYIKDRSHIDQGKTFFCNSSILKNGSAFGLHKVKPLIP